MAYLHDHYPFHISKAFEFAAAHQLQGLPDDHPCSRIHGHNYTIVLEFAAQSLNETGFVIDYRKLDVFKKWLDAEVDHRNLNHVIPNGYSNTSAENLAQWFFREAMNVLRDYLTETLQPDGTSIVLVACRVHETAKTCAEYRPYTL